MLLLCPHNFVKTPQHGLIREVSVYHHRCTKTDKVSWLPPGHPRANITEAASKIREIILLQNSIKKQQEEEDAMSLDSDMAGSEDEEVRHHICRRSVEETNQCFGSGSAWIRIKICFLNQDENVQVH